MNIEKLNMQSPDLVSQNIEKIAALFPNCVTEGTNGKVIDFDILKQELSSDLVEGNKERYRLEWPGKKQAIVTANLPTSKTLRPIRQDSVDFDKTKNVYIEGDNLEVLKILQENYLQKIKMIYIDPPYNTGKDFVYKDNFKQDKDEYQEESGQTDEYNQRLFQNPDSSGRYHSDWLSMMYPRLKLARNLLTDDGVIFISIDDNEVHNLRKMCDDVFGESQFVGTFPWRSRTAKADVPFGVSVDVEWIVAYAKDDFIAGRPGVRKYRKSDDYEDRWRLSDLTTNKTKNERPNSYFTMINPRNGNEYEASELRTWAVTNDTFDQYYKRGKIVFPDDYDFLNIKRPAYRVFESEDKQKALAKYGTEQVKMAISSYLSEKQVGRTEHGSKEIRELFGSQVFQYPKPTSLISFFIVNISDKNAVVLDFFSGASSTADAILQVNVSDRGNRKFIQVQIPEATDEKSDAYKAGYKNICEIGKERIRRAGKKIIADAQADIATKKAKLEKMLNAELEEKAGKYSFPKNALVEEKAEAMLAEINDIQSRIDKLDTGFRVYRVDSSNMEDVYYSPDKFEQGQLQAFADNVKPDRSSEDLLTQIILDWGLPLSLDIEKTDIAGKEVFKVAGNSLYACFDTGIDTDFISTIAKEKPLRIVFKDASFKGNDTAKINAKQLLKQLSPETEMKVI